MEGMEDKMDETLYSPSIGSADSSPEMQGGEKYNSDSQAEGVTTPDKKNKKRKKKIGLDQGVESPGGGKSSTLN